VTRLHAERFACGPLEIEIKAHDERVRSKIAETLELYNVRWDGELLPLEISVTETDAAAAMGDGAYLKCARMHVDASAGDGGILVSTFRSGSLATRHGSTWHVQIPKLADEFWTLIDLESLVSLVLTEGWRACGWVPVHAGTIVRNGHCAILCSESGGGKTSLTAAMIRNGWKTLGDDKLLLRIANGEPELRALVHTFNLHPRTRSWFPEVGDLEHLPVYSEWTEKRKLNPDDVWAGSTWIQQSRHISSG
jgi:hypothetical protein